MSEVKLKKYTWLSIGMACLQCGLLLLIPYSNIEGTKTQQRMAYIIAFLFWTGIIAEMVFVRLSSNQRKMLEKKSRKGKSKNKSTLGVFSFVKNREAVVADIVLFLSVIILGIVIWTNVKTEWIIIGDVSILVLSFNLHCILNGRNYRYLKENKMKKGE